MPSPLVNPPAVDGSGRRLRRGGLVLLPVACLSFVALGLRDASLGVAWPSMRASFDQPLAALGVVLLAGMVGYLVASLASGWLAAALGYRRLLMGAGVVAVAGLLMVVASPVWVGLVLGMTVLGLSAGVVDAGLNTIVAFRHGVRGLGMLHAAYGAGAVLGPLIMALVVAGPGSWRLGYGVLIVVSIAVVAAFALADFGPAATGPAHGQTQDLATPVRHRSALVCAIVLFFVYVGVEATAGQWAYSLFTEVDGLGEVAAGVWVGAFWAGFTGTRVLTGVAGHRVAPVRLIDASVAACVLGAALLWWSPVSWVGGGGLVLLGVGLAAIFPTLVALTPRRVGAERAPRAIGYQVAAAALGGAALPALFGVAAERVGLELLGPVLLAGAVVVVVLHRVAVRLERS